MEWREFRKALAQQQEQLTELFDRLDINNKIEELHVLDQTMSESDFWEDQINAKKIIAQHSTLSKLILNYQAMTDTIADLFTMESMLLEEYNEAEYQSLLGEYQIFHKEYEQFLYHVLLSGPHDSANAYLEFHAGEGGVDAQDFTHMLYRMYVRWCEKKKLTAEVVEYRVGEEAGLKSAVICVKGPYAYGYLKSEVGVHRLIRLSPFDTAKRRHTSFASITITPEMEHQDIVLQEQDIRIDTFRSSGAGGQSVNTTDSAVRITHLATGLVVTCQNERSQLQNKEYALKILRSKLHMRELEKQSEKLSELKGNKTAIGYGTQIRSYVLHPYAMVKDHRTKHEVSNVQDVLDGNIDSFIEAYLKFMAQTH